MKLKKKFITLTLVTLAVSASLTASAGIGVPSSPDTENNEDQAKGGFNVVRNDTARMDGQIAHTLNGPEGSFIDGTDHIRLDKPAYLAQGRYRLEYSGPSSTFIKLYVDCNEDGRVFREQEFLELSANSTAFVDLRDDQFVFQV